MTAQIRSDSRWPRPYTQPRSPLLLGKKKARVGEYYHDEGGGGGDAEEKKWLVLFHQNHEVFSIFCLARP